jgi:UDP-N-acetyl-L-fucosamine synthase
MINKSRKMRVMTILGTRPELIRLSRIIAALEDCFDHMLIHTGQNYDYELSDIFFKELRISKPDFFLGAAAGSAPETIGRIIIETDRILVETRPDAVLVLGDTNSCLSVLAAKKRKIPIFHLEAGNRCFDSRVPEETNRKIVDHVADVNLPYSNLARENLIREGLSPDLIIKVGSPMAEVLNFYHAEILQSKILERLALQEKKFFLVSLHREENIESTKNFERIVDVLNSISSEYGFPVIVSVHPRTRKKIHDVSPVFHENISLLRPLGYLDYNRLQIGARAVLSDSGSISEEASILGFPALNLREAHERPEAMEEAAVMMVGLNVERILQGLRILSSRKCSKAEIVQDYKSLNVSDKVAKIILSYTDYVRENVWRGL